MIKHCTPVSTRCSQRRQQPETLLATQANTARPKIKLDLADAPDEAVGQTLGRYKLL
jgi:hypothetical protein